MCNGPAARGARARCHGGGGAHELREKLGGIKMSTLTATGGVPGPGRIGRVAIGDILKRAAQRFPERVAVTDGERRVAFAEIERDANRFANYLVSRGLKPGEKIST